MPRWCWWIALWIWSHAALAHPMSRDRYSLRTAIQLDGDKLDAIVVLEVPFDVVTADLKDAMEAARTAPDAAKAAQTVLDAYTQRHWDQLAAGMAITIDGKAVKGAWKPRDNRLNGKGAVTGGFFLYIVEFVPASPVTLDDDVTIVVKNAGYPDVPMVYSCMVLPGDGWRTMHDSSKSVLPDRPYDLNAPDFWSEDPYLRTLTARFVRTGTTP